MKRPRVLLVVLLLSVVIAITAWSKEITFQLNGNEISLYPQKTWEESSLSIAIKKNDIDKIESLINEGWDINRPDENHLTALHYAITNGNTDMVKILLRHGVDVNNSDSLISPLHLAAAEDEIELIKLLIEHGAEVNLTAGSKALLTSAGKGNIEAVDLLIAHGANVNAGGDGGCTPLFEAIYNRNIEAMKTLIKHNANINHQDDRLLTPLHHAVALGFNEGVKLLLEHNADLEAKTKNDGSTPLHMAVIQGYKEIAEILLQNNADVNALDGYNQTPLNMATYHWSIIQLCGQTAIDAGTITTDEITEGRTLIREIIELLIDHGAQINLRDAILLEDMDRVKDLLIKGVDINAQDRVQTTALHHAVITNQIQMVEFLLSQDDIDLTIKAQNGMTALDMAIEMKHDELVKLLKDYRMPALH